MARANAVETHREAAERLLANAAGARDKTLRDEQMVAAQIHATLALGDQIAEAIDMVPAPFKRRRAA